jgi:hypothetical protein
MVLAWGGCRDWEVSPHFPAALFARVAWYAEFSAGKSTATDDKFRYSDRITRISAHKLRENRDEGRDKG